MSPQFKLFIRSIFLIFFCSCLFNLKAQNISKKYTSLLQEKGVLYHISTIKNFHTQKLKNAFFFDITYSTHKDSVVLNFSFFNGTLQTITNLSLDNNRLSSPVTKIFIETKKEKWVHRYSTLFAFQDLKLFFSQTKKPNIILITTQEKIPLSISNKDWETMSKIISKIFILIEQNKK